MTIFGMRRAAVSDIDDVLAVLDEAAAWLRAQGVRQWPPHFRQEWIEPDVREGNTWLAVGEEAVLATVTLDWDDPLWADRPASAGYVHRLAVRRSAAGLGARLLDWAADTAASAGRGVLRLDCVASNGRLRSYYEAAGFRHCGDARVGAPPGSRADGPGVAVSRYERQVPARAR
jgi:GNAT superfamily N-acetyltransferase